MTIYFNISDNYGNFEQVTVSDYEELNPDATFEEDVQWGQDVIIQRTDDPNNPFEIVAIGYELDATEFDNDRIVTLSENEAQMVRDALAAARSDVIDLAASSGEVHSEDAGWQPYGEDQLTKSQLQLLSDQAVYKAIVTEDQLDDLRVLVERGLVEVSMEIPEFGGVFIDAVTESGHEYMRRWHAEYADWAKRHYS